MRRLFGTIAICLLALTSCAEDGGPETAATDEPTLTEPATEEPSGTGEDIQAAGECQDNSEAEGPADLEMQEFTFAPKCLQMSASQGLRLHNEGEFKHNFSVEGFAGLDVDLEPSEENNTEATGLEVGSYTMYCKIHRESYDMEGTLKVVEG